MVDSTKNKKEKELVRVGECLTKQSFIQQGIAKYIDVWKSMMARDAMYAKDMANTPCIVVPQCGSSSVA